MKEEKNCAVTVQALCSFFAQSIKTLLLVISEMKLCSCRAGSVQFTLHT